MKKRKTKDNIRTSTERIKWFIILHLLIVMLSFCGVFAKLASREVFFSAKFIVFYVCEFGILGIYALMWQQVLRHIPLLVAFCNKAVGSIWSIVWGVILFNELFTVPMIVGTIIVLFGVFLVVTSDG